MNNLRNKVQLIGNVGQNPEIISIQKGKKIAKITLARDAYKKFAKSKNWDMMYEIAKNKATSQQTSQNVLEIMRKDVARMFNSQNGMKQLRFFSGTEREALKGFAQGTPWDKTLQNMGSLGSPRWAGCHLAS